MIIMAARIMTSQKLKNLKSGPSLGLIFSNKMNLQGLNFVVLVSSQFQFLDKTISSFF